MNRGLSFWATTLVLLVCLHAVPASAATVSYSYDGAGRLVGAQYDDGTIISWTYDKNGNLLRRTVSSGEGYALSTTIHIPLSQTAASGVWVGVWRATDGSWLAFDSIAGGVNSVTITLSNVQFDWYWIGVWDWAQNTYVYGRWKCLVNGWSTAPYAGTPTAAVEANAFGGTAISQSMRFSQYSPTVENNWYWCGVFQSSSVSWLGISSWVFPEENEIETGLWQPTTVGGDWYWIGVWDNTGTNWRNGVYVGTYDY